MLPLVWGYESALCAASAARRKEREVLFVYAIIETGGKQYKVSEGDIIFVEKLDIDVEKESEYVFKNVLAISDGTELKVGAPYLDAEVKAKALKQGKNKKIRVFRYKSKKNEKRCLGHRQPYTKLQIEKIG